MPQTEQPFTSIDFESSDVQSGQIKPDAAYADLVRGVEVGDEAAIAELYALIQRGCKWYLVRNLGTEDAEDRLHDAFLDLVRAIQAGAVRDSSCLLGFARTIVRRKIAAVIDTRVTDRQRMVTEDEFAYDQLADQSSDPERQLYENEKLAVLRKALAELAPRDREILERFYVHEQTEAQICQVMGLTACQYRNLKSRAKARLTESAERNACRKSAPKALAHCA